MPMLIILDIGVSIEF